MICTVLTGKCGFILNWRQPVLPDEAHDLQALVLQLVLDALELDHGRLVVGELEHAAEQDRHVDELGARALLDLAG